MHCSTAEHYHCLGHFLMMFGEFYAKLQHYDKNFFNSIEVTSSIVRMVSLQNLAHPQKLAQPLGSEGTSIGRVFGQFQQGQFLPIPLPYPSAIDSEISPTRRADFGELRALDGSPNDAVIRKAISEFHFALFCVG